MASALGDPKGLVTCSICFHRFEGRDPRSLPCSHSFCYGCIKNTYDSAVFKDPSTSSLLGCPNCQSASSVPSGGLQNLPAYFQVNQVGDISQHFKKVDPGCQICKQSAANVYCFTCTRTMCLACEKNHDQSMSNRNHTKVAVNESVIQSLLCTEHNEQIGAFCTDCMKVVCNICQHSTHANHIIKRFCEEHGNTTDNEFALRRRDLELAEQDLDYREQEYDAYIQETNQQMNAQKASMLRKIEEQHFVLQSQLRQSADETRANMSGLKATLQKHKTSLDGVKLLVHPIPQLNVRLDDIKLLVEDRTKGIPNTRPVLPQSTRYAFTPNTSTISFGYLACRAVTAPVLDNVSPLVNPASVPNLPSAPAYQFPTACKTDSVGVAPLTHQLNKLSTQVEEPPPAYRNLYPGPQVGFEPVAMVAAGIDPPAPGKPRLRCKIESNGSIQNMAVLPNGKILTIEGSITHCIKMYDESGLCRLPPFDVNVESLNPDGVAVHQPSGRVALRSLSENRVVVFEEQNGIWNETKFKVSDPYGLAFTPDGNYLVMGKLKWISQAMMKYTVSGKYVWQMKMSHSCHYLTINSYNQIVVSCQNDKTIYVYDENAHRLSSFPADSSQGLLRDPRDLCVDFRNNILVVDKKKQVVLMFSNNGEYMKEVVSVNRQPKFVSLLNNTCLIVGNDEKEIYIYDVNLS